MPEPKTEERLAALHQEQDLLIAERDSLNEEYDDGIDRPKRLRFVKMRLVALGEHLTKLAKDIQAQEEFLAWEKRVRG